MSDEDMEEEKMQSKPPRKLEIEFRAGEVLMLHQILSYLERFWEEDDTESSSDYLYHTRALNQKILFSMMNDEFADMIDAEAEELEEIAKRELGRDL